MYVFAVCVFAVYKKRHPGVIGTRIHRETELRIARRWRWFGCRNDTPGLITNRALREIQNYTNGRKTLENIPFEIKKIIDSREWIPKEWRETPGKYSVQIQKFQIQRVNPIRSKHFTAKNIRFKIQKF